MTLICFIDEGIMERKLGEMKLRVSKHDKVHGVIGREY